MKKFAKSLFLILAIAVLATAFASTSFAADTVITSENVYLGEYETEKHSGFAMIVFGQVSNVDAEYGVIVTDKVGNSYAFEGKAIGADGKFGIAIYELEVDNYYYVKSYSGNPEDGVYGETYAVYVCESSMPQTNVIDFHYHDNGDNTVTVTATMKGDTVCFTGMDFIITFASQPGDVTYASSQALWTGGSAALNYDGAAGELVGSFAGSVDTTASCDLFSVTLSYEEGCKEIYLYLTVEDIYDANFETMSYIANGGVIFLD